MNDPNKLLFIHIPKTGGMSIKSIIGGLLFDLDFNDRHLTAEAFCSRISKQLYDKLYKFTVVRNPYDRLVSYYYFMLNDIDHKEHVVQTQTLSEYIVWASEGNVATQFEQVSIHGRIAVNRLLKFENLQEDWSELAQEFGLQEYLPCVNESMHSYWQDEFSPADMQIIYESFEVDFKMFGYCK